MPERVRPYVYYDVAVSICSTCLRRVDAKIVFQDGNVLLLKHCNEHGDERVLVADDIEYYRRVREVFLKPGEMPVRFNTPVKWGCPYDCGLCTDHEQHSCLSLIDVCDHCNLECPVCYASSGPSRKAYRSLEQVEAMLDAVVRNEGRPDVVQLSGGEPTIHPRFFEILDASKARPIRHLMVNTNGVRIANDDGFAERLATYAPGFEVYLQFDSLEAAALKRLRGVDLRDVRLRALDRLDALGLSTTLVVTLARGVNDDEIGRIVEFALTRPCVRGVTFQPMQFAGRREGFDPATDRLTLTEVRRRLLEQTDVFSPADVVPVPCHPDAIAMAYAFRRGETVVPLTGLVGPELLLEGARNTIVFEQDEGLRERLIDAFSTRHSPESSAASLRELLCCLPLVDAPDISYEDVFRVLIIEFMDAHSFDVRSVKRSCIHFVHPEDGRLIPFDTYNLFYRDGLEQEVLAPLRLEREAGA